MQTDPFLLGEVLYYVAHIEKDQIGKLFDLCQLIVMVFIAQMKSKIATDYNQSMGGVDLNDMMSGIYEDKRKTKAM